VPSDRRRTIGYIVVGGDDVPVSWSETERAFYDSVATPNERGSVSHWQPGEYARVRKHIAEHYRSLDSAPWAEGQEFENRFHGLRIIRLVAP
jgi:hypothetical protein